MKNITPFNEFSQLVWDPKRKPVDAKYMPSDEDKELYIGAIKEEIDTILDDIYQLSPSDSEKIQYVIWTTHIDEWKDILDDSLVNWDTPAQAAQKCVNYMKNFFNLT